MNRRTFLKGSGLLLGASFIGASRAIGAEERIAPSERITVGLVGVGKMGHGHLGSLLSEGDVQLVAVCDVWQDRLQAAQESVEAHYAEEKRSGSFKGCSATTDFMEVVEREDIDAVLTATPDHWHALVAAHAARAGKDVYCEKPLTRTIAEARTLADTVKQYGCVFQTGSQQRSSREFRLACEMVRNGRIGKVHTVHVNVGGPASECDLAPEPTPEVLDWDRWLGPAPWRPYNKILSPPSPRAEWPRWRYYWDYSGGGMTDWGAHHFDIAQWGLDMDDSGPVEVIPPNENDVERLTYKYANGVVMFHGGGKQGVDFIGDQGRITVNRGFLETEPEGLDKEPIGPNEIHLYHSNSHRGNWIECIKNRRPTICTAEIGCRSVTVCHIGNIAYRLKRPLRWDPLAERFKDDEEANRFLSVPMRSPWRV